METVCKIDDASPILRRVPQSRYKGRATPFAPGSLPWCRRAC